LSSPSASAEGGSSTGHPSTEDPGGRKLVSGGSQMDCGKGQGHSVICSEPTGDRFRSMAQFTFTGPCVWFMRVSVQHVLLGC